MECVFPLYLARQTASLCPSFSVVDEWRAWPAPRRSIIHDRNSRIRTKYKCAPSTTRYFTELLHAAVIATIITLRDRNFLCPVLPRFTHSGVFGSEDQQRLLIQACDLQSFLCSPLRLSSGMSPLRSESTQPIIIDLDVYRHSPIVLDRREFFLSRPKTCHLGLHRPSRVLLAAV